MVLKKGLPTKLTIKKKTFQGCAFQNRPYVSKTAPKRFLKCTKRSGSE